MVHLISKKNNNNKKKSKKIIQKGAVSSKDCLLNDYYRTDPDKIQECVTLYDLDSKNCIDNNYFRYDSDKKEECSTLLDLHTNEFCEKNDYTMDSSKNTQNYPCDKLKCRENKYYYDDDQAFDCWSTTISDTKTCLQSNETDPEYKKIGKENCDFINKQIELCKDYDNDCQNKYYPIISGLEEYCDENGNFEGTENKLKDKCENVVKKKKKSIEQESLTNERESLTKEQCVNEGYWLNSGDQTKIDQCRNFYPNSEECRDNNYYDGTDNEFLKMYCNQFKPLTIEACVNEDYWLKSGDQTRIDECSKFYPNSEECRDNNYYDGTDNEFLQKHCNQFKQSINQNLDVVSTPVSNVVSNANSDGVSNTNSDVVSNSNADVESVTISNNLPEWAVDPINKSRMMSNPVLYLKNFQIYDRDNLPEKVLIIDPVANENCGNYETLDQSLLIPQQKLKLAIDEYKKKLQGGKRLVKSRINKQSKHKRSRVIRK
jgi:hypothetical protein